jgi:AcrR family transcriptional regulator
MAKAASRGNHRPDASVRVVRGAPGGPELNGSGGASGRAPDKKALRSEDTRRRVVEAALDVFASKGFHGATTRDIARGAGMSPAALYVHYESKEELLYLLSSDGHARVLELMRDAAETSSDPVEQLRAVMHAFAVYHARRHRSARVVNYELGALTPGHWTAIMRYRTAIDEQLRDIVEAGVEQGVLSTPHPHMTCTALLSLGIDIARWYREDGEWSPEEIADHYAQLALRMLHADLG